MFKVLRVHNAEAQHFSPRSDKQGIYMGKSMIGPRLIRAGVRCDADDGLQQTRPSRSRLDS